MTDTTEDDFLGGRLRLLQPRQGYRAGIDPVLLAASIPAQPGQTTLDLGTGCGVALFCLMSRVPGLTAFGIERDPTLARLATENASRNGLDARIIQADVADLPADIRSLSVDHVFANPPFFNRHHGSPSALATREGGRGTETPLSTWLDVATKRLRPGGTLTIIQRVERLPELLAGLDHRLGDVTLLPLSARVGRAPKLVLVQARKGAKGAFRMRAPLVLHDGAAHERDCDDYSEPVAKILRHAAPLELRELMNR